jgi:hypothetical protein
LVYQEIIFQIYLNKIQIKNSLNFSNSTGNIFEMNRKNEKKNYNLVWSFSQLEREKILNPQINVHFKERKFSPLIPKIQKKYNAESINISSFTFNFNNNIFSGIESNIFPRFQIEEQLKKIKRIENLFKKCFNYIIIIKSKFIIYIYCFTIIFIFK